ncbi:MAG TPA: efflux RND transporter permease subunit, partial [Candidatus Baltobacteraceae bacterium]|nr:efflux RND transporter permease subunit [Candidatus Baltobacteraceae bacterium]
MERFFSISRLAIDYPRATIVFWIAISVAGLFSFFSLKVALFPDITFPVVVVTARTTSIDPATNERTITVPVEAALRGVRGLTRIHSLSYPQFVVIDTSFDVGTSIAAREQAVQDALLHVKLPPGTSLTVSPENLNEIAVVSYALTQAGRTMADLAGVAERDVAPRLRAIPGVLKVEIIGAVDSGPNASAFRYDGHPAIGINVIKRADANTLDIAEACGDVMADVATYLKNVTITPASSQAVFIREATRATEEALGLAIVLAILVIWPFLGDARATMISALAIPVSLFGTAIVMRLFHFNLETITLLALSLVVGVILDDAIVAVENIVRHVEAGQAPREAALLGNKEIGLTLVAASLTIVAVFLPIGLMRGTLGQFFRPFGLTASAAILFSLLAARTLSPTLAAIWLRPRENVPPAVEIDTNRTLRHSSYRRILDWALGHRKVVVTLALCAFAAGIALVPFIPKGFIPHLDRGEFIITFSTPLGTSLSDTIAAAAQLEAATRSDRDVRNVFTTIGGPSAQSNMGTLDVQLRSDRHEKTIEVENTVRSKLPALDGVHTSVGDVPFVGNTTAKPLQFALLGDDLEELRTVGRDFLHRLRAEPGFEDVTATGLSDGTPFSAIEHVSNRRAVQITADLAPNFALGDANDRVALLAKRYLPRDIKLSFGG